MQKITTCLWFNTQAEEAANFYVSLFKNSKIGRILRYDAASAEVSGMPEGSVLTVEFEIEGREFTALNGGPIFKFNESVSFIVDCNSQEEVDYYWNALTANGGEESQCGWLKDKYGVSWQITPRQLVDAITDSDRGRAGRAMRAMLEMRKIDIQTILDAADNKT
jgi:predicted 3-demethylubiquinone-9 3-methyltransferase (glyoxalase superfamily)